jgi:hypothetical protein
MWVCRTAAATGASLMILLHDLVLESLLAIHLVEVVHVLTIGLLSILNSFLTKVLASGIWLSIFKNCAWSELFVFSEHHLFSLYEVTLFFNR